MQLDDSTYLLGTDTLHTNRPSYWKANGNHIYNINTGNVGIHRTNPNVLLDLPGPVNIDDTSSYRINYHPILKVGDLESDGYTNIYAGDSSGVSNGNIYNTFVGGRAGINSSGGGSAFLGYAAGHDSQGDNNTFTGGFSGQNNSVDDISGLADRNSFYGYGTGQYSSGAGNTFSGTFAGSSNNGLNNNFIGLSSGQNSYGSYNNFQGDLSGLNNTGIENVFLGSSTGYFNQGDNNILIGENSGRTNIGYRNVFTGLNAGQNNQGSDNTFIGSGAGYEQAYGSSITENGVTLLGSNAIVGNVSNILNATAIGAKSVVKASNTMVFGDTAMKSWLFNSNAVAASGAALVVGSNSTNGNGAYLTTGGVWTNASDQFKKENFEPLDNKEILDKIGQLPITRWNYKGLSEQHIGPVAQDFYRIFRVGTDDKTISTIDPSGVALAGIQRLYRKWQEAEQRSEDLQSRINKQQSQLADLQSRLQRQEEEITALKDQRSELEYLKREMDELKKNTRK
jgi:carbonic anhydrase/acetyltransferase-like protein (isoleucine patch superfamily)